MPTDTINEPINALLTILTHPMISLSRSGSCSNQNLQMRKIWLRTSFLKSIKSIHQPDMVLMKLFLLFPRIPPAIRTSPQGNLKLNQTKSLPIVYLKWMTIPYSTLWLHYTSLLLPLGKSAMVFVSLHMNLVSLLLKSWPKFQCKDAHYSNIC